MNARKFLDYAYIEVNEDTLSSLTRYVKGGDYDFGIDYAQFPDGEVGSLLEDPDEPSGFQAYVEGNL